MRPVPPAPERPSPDDGKKLPQLDALRGIAILAVFTQHLGDRFLPLVRGAVEQRLPPSLVPWVLTVLHHAWWGVDLFFVLSGFSLSLSYIRSNGAPLGAFFLRRAARILPAYYLALAVTLLFHRTLVFAPHFSSSLFAHLLVLQGYWAPGGLIFIGATWSLTTEISYYLVFPWLARALLDVKRGLFFLALLVVLGWVMRAVLHALYVEPDVWTPAFETTQRRLLPARMDQFVLGMIAARLFVSLAAKSQARRLAPWVVLASLPLLVLAFRLEGTFFLRPWGTAAYAFLSLVTAILVLSASLLEGRARKLFTPRPLVFIGIASYGIFLYHQLALGLCDLDRGLPPSWGNLGRTALLALALSVAVGHASWVLVEKPLIRLATRKRLP